MHQRLFLVSILMIVSVYLHCLNNVVAFVVRTNERNNSMKTSLKIVTCAATGAVLMCLMASKAEAGGFSIGFGYRGGGFDCRPHCGP